MVYLKLRKMPGCTPAAAWTREEAAEEKTSASLGPNERLCRSGAIRWQQTRMEPNRQRTIDFLSNCDMSSDETFFSYLQEAACIRPGA